MADQAGGNGVRRQPAVATAPNSASASGAVTLGADVPIPAAPYYIEKLLKHNPCTEVIMWAENHSGVWVRPELTPSLRRAWGPIDVDAYIAWCTLRDKELEDARASLASTVISSNYYDESNVVIGERL
ncbi:hypothetical protein SLS60_011606 [Paraconiothyrium brasiliense]|uniref:Uncharacterized protein n=1 Tax=Paraconiothyrium brasiliense TaxID=300254 RepID=A0ABR3QIM8_9PLEO